MRGVGDREPLGLESCGSRAEGGQCLPLRLCCVGLGCGGLDLRLRQLISQHMASEEVAALQPAKRGLLAKALSERKQATLKACRKRAEAILHEHRCYVKINSTRF